MPNRFITRMTVTGLHASPPRGVGMFLVAERNGAFLGRLKGDLGAL
jgi:hypothetical protein